MDTQEARDSHAFGEGNHDFNNAAPQRSYDGSEGSQRSSNHSGSALANSWGNSNPYSSVNVDERALESIARALGGAEKTTAGWKARCPSHNDKDPSLSLTVKDGTLLVYCHAGCPNDAVVNALRQRRLWPGVNGSDGGFPNGVWRQIKGSGHKYSAHWTYRDADGKVLGYTVRYDHPDKAKEFRPFFRWEGDSWICKGPEGPNPIYGLDRLSKRPDATVVVTEGEKACDAAQDLLPAHVAITSLSGSNSPHKTDWSPLKGRSVIIWPDNDEPGAKYANAVSLKLRGVGAILLGIVDGEALGLRKKGDAADWPAERALPDPLPLIHSLCNEGQHPTEKPEPPRPLRRALPQPEAFPVEALGDILAAAAQALHAAIRAPLALCSQSVLAATCLAAQGFADVSIDGRRSPISCYFMSIGQSGERKTAVDNEALLMHRDYQGTLQQDYAIALHSYANASDAFKKAREDVLKKVKDPSEKRRALDALGMPSEGPMLPLILAQEPTLEGLFNLLRDGRPSVGLFSDEAGTFIGGHGMNEENRLKMGAGLSSLWDGKPWSRVRAGDGAFELRGKRVSAHLMAQPNVAARFLTDRMLAEQGLLSRFLTCYPDSTVGTRFYNPIDLTKDGAMLKYHERMKALLKAPFPTLSTDSKILDPRMIGLSSEAKDLWIKFHNLIEEQLGDEQPLSFIRGFGNKSAEHALRLAGVLSIFDNSEVKEIDREHMASGIELTQFYLSEALRLFHAGACDPKLEQAEKLLGWIGLHKREFIYPRLVYRHGPPSIRDQATAKGLIQILQDHGWLEPVDGGMELDGAPRKQAWRVVTCSND